MHFGSNIKISYFTTVYTVVKQGKVKYCPTTKIVNYSVDLIARAIYCADVIDVISVEHVNDALSWFMFLSM